jgi:hypothetical protein
MTERLHKTFFCTLAVTVILTLLTTVASAGETGAGQKLSDVEITNELAVDEDAALDLVWNLTYLTDLRTEHPDARLVLTVTGTPDEEEGRWCVKAMTDEGTHYATVGIYFVNATTGDVTKLDPLTGEESPAGNP